MVATIRRPRGIPVNGAYVLVRDPSAASTGLFAKYRRLSGLANFTLPNETGGTNETPLQDGVVSTASIKGVGTITGTIGAIGGDPVFEFMEEKSDSGEEMTMAIITLAKDITDFAIADARVANANDRAITGIGADNAKKLVRVGDLVFIGGAKPAAAKVLGREEKTTGNNPTEPATNAGWRRVMTVFENGTLIVTPGFAAAITADPGRLYVRRPGRVYKDLLGVLNQYGKGDYQQGQVITAPVTFAPSDALPSAQQIASLVLEPSESDGTYDVSSLI